MVRKTTTMMIASIIFVLMACSVSTDPVKTSLDTAEVYLDSRPDTVLSILDSIQHPEKLTGEMQARYALIKTQALDKTYQELTSDSLIFLALSYYKDKEEIVPKAKAYFYYGKYLRTLGAYEEAQKSLEEATLLLEDTDEHKLLGMFYTTIGNIYHEVKLHDQSLENYRLSLPHTLLSNDSTNLSIAYRNIGLSYSMNGQIDSTLYYYNEALKIAEISGSNFESVFLQDIGSVYRSLDDYDKAEIYLKKAVEKGYGSNIYPFKLSLGYIHLLKEEYLLAESLLKECTNSPSLFTRSDAYNGLYKLEKLRENYSLALLYKETSDSLATQARENITVNQRKIENISRSFLQARFDEKYLKKQNEHMHLTIIFLTFIFIVIIVGLYTFNRFRNNMKTTKRIQGEIRANLKEISQYKGLLYHYEQQNDQLKMASQKEITDLKARIDLLSEKNTALESQLKNQKRQEELAQKTDINRYVNGLFVYCSLMSTPGLKISDNDAADLFFLFNLLFNNYVDRLRKFADEKISKHDLQLACLVRLGYGNDRIGEIFNTKSSSVSKSKSRLKVKLNIDEDKNLDDFLKSF